MANVFVFRWIWSEAFHLLTLYEFLMFFSMKIFYHLIEYLTFEQSFIWYQLAKVKRLSLVRLSPTKDVYFLCKYHRTYFRLSFTQHLIREDFDTNPKMLSSKSYFTEVKFSPKFHDRTRCPFLSYSFDYRERGIEFPKTFR